MNDDYEDTDVDPSSAGAIIEVVERLCEPSEVALDADAKVVVLPKGLRIESLRKFEDERLDAPRRREGTSRQTTLDSFLEHVERFKDEGSAIFADDSPTKPSLLAVYDYHEDAKGSPRFGKHRALYEFPLSDEWKAWAELAKLTAITQSDLAEFLESHLADVLPAERAGDSIVDTAATYGIDLAGPTRLVELARNLTVRAESKVVSVQNPSTGEARLVYEENHSDEIGGPVKVPGGFAIAIPVFRGGPGYQIAVRLRYRLLKGSVVFRIQPHRAETVFTHAFDEAAEKARDATLLPVFYGKPEA